MSLRRPAAGVSVYFVDFLTQQLSLSPMHSWDLADPEAAEFADGMNAEGFEMQRAGLIYRLLSLSEVLEALMADEEGLDLLYKQMEFSGKIALLCDDKLLTDLRDDIQPFLGPKCELPGGGREGEETPLNAYKRSF